MIAPLLGAANVDVGAHIARTFLGMTINVDDLWSTVAAGLIVIGLGLAVRMRATSGVPGKLQLAFEAIVGSVESQIEQSMGDAGKPIVPLAVTLFMFILIANWFELLPTGHNPQYLPAPTSDINLTAAAAVFVIVLVHVTWISKQGLRSYLRHYFRPFAFLFPINVIEEITKPITLALRLFGNIFSSAILLLLIADLIPAKLIVGIPVLDVVWKLFDGLFVSPVQAFIFTLLTILYFESAIAGSGH